MFITMCIWKKADHSLNRSDGHQTILVTAPFSSRTRKRRIRRHDYIWDLDDGYPGFIRHSRNNRLSLFVDSDRNGFFTRDDELIGRARIRSTHRRRRRGLLLQEDQLGSIRALNASSDSDSSSHHVELTAGVDLEFTHPDGSLVALFAGVQV